MSKKICEKCGIAISISKMRRHKFGYRIKDVKGKIVKIPRCIRQHLRKDDKQFKKGIHNGTGQPYSQGYT